MVNDIENSSSKRQKRFMIADVTKFKKKDISAFFKQTALISKDFHQSKKIYENFSKRCSIDDSAIIWLLTRFFFDTESSNFFDQFSKICTTFRQNQNLSTFQIIHSLRQVVQALNSLNVQFFVASVLRRYFLVSLKIHKMKLKKEHQHSLSVRSKKTFKRLAIFFENEQSQTVSIFDRADTQALKKMMEKTYSDLQSIRRIRNSVMNDYQRKLTILKKRIRSERNWKIFQEKFESFILFLISSKNEYNIRDFE